MNLLHRNVFVDVGFPPDEAVVLALHSDAAIALSRWIRRRKLTQAAAAKRLKLTQPTVSCILNGNIQRFSTDFLIRACIRAGITVRVSFTLPTKKKP